MAKIINGKQVAEEKISIIKKEIDYLGSKNIIPGLAVIIIGNDKASHTYVKNKEKVANNIGFFSKIIKLKEDISEELLLNKINELNNDDSIDGILVQSPFPNHISKSKVIESINPSKDVDCFHPFNLGNLLIGEEFSLVPCTPYGCLELLKYYNIETESKHCVVIGRSNIVGKPMMALMIQKNTNSTVTLTHSRTKNLTEICLQADIIISAIGKSHFVKDYMVKKGAVVIDVGINYVKDTSKKSGFKLVGDVDFDKVEKKASYITPVPGGVGPMTIAMLMRNTLISCEKRNNIESKYQL